MSETIGAGCYSNIDGFEPFNWPRFWVSLPRIGDRVLSLDGEKLMKVVGVEHRIDLRDGVTPVAIIELGSF